MGTMHGEAFVDSWLMRPGSPIEEGAGVMQADDIDRGLRLAEQFGREGKKMLQNHVILGEDRAIDATQGAQLTGKNVHYIGGYGADKTELLRHGHRLVAGITEIATLPTRADLTASQIMGVSQTYDITESQGDSISTRAVSNRSKGTIGPRSQVIHANEIRRISPYGISSIFEVLENRTYDSEEGTIALKALEYAAATSNPFSRDPSQFKLSGGIMARFPWGAIMGEEQYWDTVTGPISMQDWEPSPLTMKPVITLPELHLARAALGGIVIPEKVRAYMAQLSQSVATVLKEHDQYEAPGRINVQLKRNARALAALKGEKQVDEQRLHEALAYKITGSLGGNILESTSDVWAVVQAAIEKTATANYTRFIPAPTKSRS